MTITARGMGRLRRRGQLTLPTQVREAAHLEEGDPVVFEMVAEGILIRPQKVIDATQAWFWTAAWQRGEAVASEEIAAGRTRVHKSTEDFLAALED